MNIELFHTFGEKMVYFIIRQRKNISFNVVKEHIVSNELGNVKDQTITLKSDTHKEHFRLIIFKIAGKKLYLLTNRFDLPTREIIMLYAFR